MIIEKKCKKCRRAGEKLFLKGEKCFTPKCVLEKKPFPPGLPFSARKHRSMLTEYGIQLKEKQKKAGQGNKGKKRRSTEILDEIIKQKPKTLDELLTLLDKHESIYEVDHDRKQYIYYKKNGEVSAAISFNSILEYLTKK